MPDPQLPPVSAVPPVLVLPGLFGSGPDHWQTRLEAAFPSARRVEQRDWERPDRAEWVGALDRAVRECATPPVLAAHSLGCVTTAVWAENQALGLVRGALLVAPSDVERPDAPPAVRGFAPIPMKPLPFPSILVSSSNDLYLTVARSRELAAAWGSRWIDVGAAGHVNSAAGFGPWPGGRVLLEELLLLGVAPVEKSERPLAQDRGRRIPD